MGSPAAAALNITSKPRAKAPAYTSLGPKAQATKWRENRRLKARHIHLSCGDPAQKPPDNPNSTTNLRPHRGFPPVARPNRCCTVGSSPTTQGNSAEDSHAATVVLCPGCAPPLPSPPACSAAASSPRLPRPSSQADPAPQPARLLQRPCPAREAGCPWTPGRKGSRPHRLPSAPSTAAPTTSPRTRTSSTTISATPTACLPSPAPPSARLLYGEISP